MIWGHFRPNWSFFLCHHDTFETQEFIQWRSSLCFLLISIILILLCIWCPKLPKKKRRKQCNDTTKAETYQFMRLYQSRSGVKIRKFAQLVKWKNLTKTDEEWTLNVLMKWWNKYILNHWKWPSKQALYDLDLLKMKCASHIQVQEC